MNTGKLINRLNRIWTAKYWAICYRKSRFGLLKSLNEEIYQLLSYNPYVTIADPFMYNYQGDNWLFFEKKAIKEKRGILWCRNLDDKSCKEMKVLEEPFHLSYPNVFSVRNQIYMIPETMDAGEIRLYKCIEFPASWKYVGAILKENAVDTTLFFTPNDIFYMYSYIGEKLYVFQVEYEDFEDIDTYRRELIYCSERDLTLRGGGNFICMQNRIIRISQDCRERYGGALFCYECEPSKPETMWDKEWKRITADQIRVNGFRSKWEQIRGIHTYNCNEEYELIDILVFKSHWTVPFRKIYWYLLKGKF